MAESPPTTVRSLRHRWKPTKERLQEIRGDHPTNIRFHRACSWLGQVEVLGGTNSDLALICQWTAFNSLYGLWDEGKREPLPDRECWRKFCDRILALDTNGQMSAILTEHKKLVMALLDDEYLSRYFWEDPSPKRAGQSKGTEKGTSLIIDVAGVVNNQ
jgi:hypothetical protein